MEALDVPLSRVWVVNDRNFSPEKASNFGGIKYLTRGYIPFDQLSRLQFKIATEIITTKAEDYLLLSGAVILCIIAAIEWYQLHGKVNILNWDKKADDGQGNYRLVTITDKNLKELIRVMDDTIST